MDGLLYNFHYGQYPGHFVSSLSNPETVAKNRKGSDLLGINIIEFDIPLDPHASLDICRYSGKQ